MQEGRLCRTFQATGRCSYGSNCRFVHAANDFHLQASLQAGESTSYTQTSNQASFFAVSRQSVHQRLSFPDPRGSAGRSPSGRSVSWQSGSRGGAWAWGQGRGGSSAQRGGRSVSPGPETRRWLYNPKQRGKESFLVVSYNILSSRLAAEHAAELYWHVGPPVLAWENRRRAILQELQQLAPHIICLQEVDHFDEVQSDLSNLGYEGTFKGRTGTDMTDGCATFWKAEKFTAVAVEELEFKDLGLRENVAILTVLKYEGGPPEFPPRLVVIANTHILFNPKRGDIKLAQLRHLLEQAHELSNKYDNAPVLIMGDFNSTPESALYHYLSSGRLDLAETDRRNMSGQMEGVFHSGRPWQPYRPSARISIPEQLLHGSDGDDKGGTRSISADCEDQVETASSSREARDEAAIPRDADQLEGQILDARDRSASPVSFGGLSSSLGGALRNESGLELKRARCEEQENVKLGSYGGAYKGSDQDRGVGMECREEQAAQRRKLRMGMENEKAFDLESEQGRSGQSEGAQEVGCRVQSAGHVEPPVAGQENSEYPQFTGMSEGFSAQLREARATPSISGEEALASSATDAAPTTTGRVISPGPGATWQSQQRNNWGRRRPPGIDYVWDDEEFKIAGGGGRESVVRHPLEGMTSAYAAVRQPRFRGEPVCAREPACTTFHGKARGTVDYIWFTPGLHPVRVLDTLPMQSLQRLRGLPTERWPSDHFSIACGFSFEGG